jgi:transketolase
MERIAQVHARNLVRWAADKPEVLVFSGDLTGSTEIGAFRDAYPDRFFSMGMAEQNMLSFAGGMAREGFCPFVHTFAVFLYRRALDQLEMSIAYPNLRVRLFGFLPGIMTPGGVTHQAINDIGVLRAVPNLTILETGDATDVESVLDAAHGIDGPVYVRMIRKEIPRLFPADEPLILGKCRRLRTGADLAIVTSGICTEEAIRVCEALKGKGVSITHLHVSTLKPFYDEAIAETASTVKYGVITMENHTILGGLFTGVAELLGRWGVQKRIHPLGLKDTYAHGASARYLMREYGIDAWALLLKVQQVLDQDFGISEEDLQSLSIDDYGGEGQLEAL